VTKLKELTFHIDGLYTMWIATALKTITSEHKDFHRISIYNPFRYSSPDDPDNLRQIVGEATYLQWMDLDLILVRLWESRSVCTRVYTLKEDEGVCKSIRCLLPEATKRGVIELVADKCWIPQVQRKKRRSPKFWGSFW
jgi:hypothetical protein